MNGVRILAAAAAVVALGTGAGTAVAATAATAPASAHAGHGPRIVANPVSVMVNMTTKLRGYGFKPGAKVLLWECSARNWVVPVNVCNHANAVRVRTDHRGRFQVTFKVLVCPVSSAAVAVVPAVPAGFQRTCFIGEPKVNGIDTEELRGAVKITVTGP